MTNKKLEEVVYMSWEESERDWGTRPEGCSLHLTIEDCKKYSKEYWSKMPEQVPYAYEREAGRPVPVQVSQSLYNKIKGSKYGIRLSNNSESEAVKKGELVYGKNRSGWVTLK